MDYGRPRDVTRIKEDLAILRKGELKFQRTHLVQEGIKGTSTIRP